MGDDLYPGDCELLCQIFEQRLGTGLRQGAAIDLTPSDRARLIERFIGLLRQLSSLMNGPASAVSRPSLPRLLEQLVSLVTQSLNADRSSLFLYDPERDELYSYVAQGDLDREIRIPAGQGVAGRVFRSGTPAIITDAYRDVRFSPAVDEITGYTTRSILCVPLRNWDGRIIGVTEALNKRQGVFDIEDRALLEALTSHAASALESVRMYESMERALRDEAQMLDITSALSSELHLDALLVKIMDISTDVLEAERSTLLLYDEVSDELRSKIAQGLETREIRIPADAGIAGAVFTGGQIVNIADAYGDPRFNPEVDRKTGYRTRSILCVPVITHAGETTGTHVSKTIGIIQVLNKRGGPFRLRDEQRLTALAAQAAIAIENARLFEEVQNARNYSESILQSLSNGVITLDAARKVTKVNPTALRILALDEQNIVGLPCDALFCESNRWILDALDKVEPHSRPTHVRDAEICRADGELISVNVHLEPLIDVNKHPIGYLIVIEDITKEKRVRSTMARYMSQELAERLLTTNESQLGGQAQEVSVLFSDIEDFTGLTENMGAQATVAMLNDYFAKMEGLVFQHRGILDKYIGDAIMALFGTPFPGPDDADNAVRTAIAMEHALREFNHSRARRDEQAVRIRIGISTGDVVVGNIGSERRMDYTVVGHTANVVSRVEGANRYYGTRILITDTTRARLRGSYRLRELDRVRVKGSGTPLALYEVLDGPETRGTTALDLLIEEFAAGLARYRARDWGAATTHFRSTLNIRPDDPPSRLFLRRCADYAETPPPPQWDGVWNLGEK
jgi:adenylate cyclase